MLKNYLKIAWRNIAKGKLYSTINISGLTVALASFVLALLYLNYELSYDKWHPELEKIYKISFQRDGDILPTSPGPLAAFLKEKLPAIASSVRLQDSEDYEILISVGDKQIFQKNIITTDSLFFTVFPYRLIQGNPLTVLQQPNAAIISRELALKLFGNENPVGKTGKLYNARDFIITGVFAKPAAPSSINPEMIVRDEGYQGINNWQNYSFDTYIRLKSLVGTPKIVADINSAFYNERIKKDSTSFKTYQQKGSPTRLLADQFTQLHNFPSHGNSGFKTIAILLTLAGLLLLTGAINFSNLSIAASIRRAKEVGIRKVMGSSRINIARQFLFETTLQIVLCLFFAMLLVWLAIPLFKQMFSISHSLVAATNPFLLALQIAACLLIVIILSGIYPSLFLSRFATAKVLKGDYSHGTKGRLLRNGLVVAQFVLSGFFIVTTLGIHKQMHYMSNQDKGFSGEQVMRLQVSQKIGEEGFETLRNNLLAVRGVQSVAKTSNVPGDSYPDTATSGYKIGDKIIRLGTVKVSTDYFNTLDIPLLKGRLFDGRHTDQNTASIILNESAAKKTGLADPVGKTIYFPFCADKFPAQVVGVVKDFHTREFATAITPQAYSINNKACGYMWGGAVVIKLAGADLRPVIASIENVWKKTDPDTPIRYSFLDDNFQQLLKGYVRTEKIILFFTIISITIALMGLFALTAFFTSARSKEISIRKVVGAGVSDITGLLSKGFVKMVLLGVVIALPVAGIAINKWLETFAYRTTIEWWVYLVAVLIVVAAAVITISIQTIKAALANPVKSLRTE